MEPTFDANPTRLVGPSALDLPSASVPPSVAQSADALPQPPSVGAQLDPALPPILVADDDADDVFFIQRLIRKTGVKNPVRVFDDGSEVVNFLGGVRRHAPSFRRRPPLLLFLDLKMRGLGGFGFLEWAQQQKLLLSPLTIVVLSHSSEPENVARALELGAHRYLVKYPSPHTISTIVRSVYPLTVF